MIEYIDFQIGAAGNPNQSDPGGGSIESCFALVVGLSGSYDIRHASEWGGGTVATVRDGQLQVL